MLLLIIWFVFVLNTLMRFSLFKCVSDVIIIVGCVSVPQKHCTLCLKKLHLFTIAIVCYRLNGSPSPALTATHHSYGSLAWLSDISPTPLKARPPVDCHEKMARSSNYVDSRKDVPFAVNIATFHILWSTGHLKVKIWKICGLWTFLLDFDHVLQKYLK